MLLFVIHLRKFLLLLPLPPHSSYYSSITTQTLVTSSMISMIISEYFKQCTTHVGARSNEIYRKFNIYRE